MYNLFAFFYGKSVLRETEPSGSPVMIDGRSTVFFLVLKIRSAFRFSDNCDQKFYIFETKNITLIDINF